MSDTDWHDELPLRKRDKRIAELEAALRELVEAFNPAPNFDYEPLTIWDRAAKVLANK